MIENETEKVVFLRANYQRLGLKGSVAALGITKGQIWALRRKHGLPKLTKASHSQVCLEHALKPSNQYSVNPDQFVNVAIPEIAYLLGFIWADGYIAKPRGFYSGVTLTIATSDMKDIAKTLDKTGRWCYRDMGPQERSTQPASTAYISNRVLADHLVAHGYAGKSTGSADAILATIPEHLRHYWFRGLFDGDGCLHLADHGARGVRWSISSSYRQDWGYLKALCLQLGVGYRIGRRTTPAEKLTGRHNRGSNLMMTRRADIHVMMEYLYQGREHDGIGLERKWIRWCELKAMRFKSANNRYLGVISRPDGKWRSMVCKRLGADKSYQLGVFDTEQEAYDAQQNELNRLGIVFNREREWGIKHQVAGLAG